MPGFNAAIVRRGIAVVVCALALGFCLLVLSKATLRPAHAHDSSGYWAQMAREGKAPDQAWWNSLGARGHGLCCSFADGFKVEDVDWDTQDGAYRVRLRGAWIKVPEEALVTIENRYGPAVVWPTCSFVDTVATTTPCGSIDKTTGKMNWSPNVKVTDIRCFLPGAGA